jgi:hypothetical protein
LVWSVLWLLVVAVVCVDGSRKVMAVSFVKLGDGWFVVCA